MRPRAILFDLGNTLLQYGLYGRWREFLTRQLEVVYETVCDGAASRHVSPQVFATVASEVIGGDRSHQLRNLGRSWPFPARLQEATAQLSLTCDPVRVAQVMEAFYAPIHASTSLYPDTLAVLERLRAQEVKLAIISDTPWDLPGRFCLGDMQQWGIDGYFGATVFSGDRPWRKPNPEMLRAAARELDVPLESCVVVGDTLAAEIAAANTAGLPSIWIDRDSGQQPWEGATPTAVARSLTEAVELAL
jgi:FMN phosphatase YigB (HAD superfamily)